MEHAGGMSVSEIRLAGVYLEKILKQTDSSIWMRPKTFPPWTCSTCFMLWYPPTGIYNWPSSVGSWPLWAASCRMVSWFGSMASCKACRVLRARNQLVSRMYEWVGTFYHFYRAVLLWVSFTPFQTSYFSYLRLLRAGMGSDCSTGQMLGFLRPFVSVDLLLQNTCVFPAHQTWWLAASFQSGNWWPGGGSSA